MNPVKFILVDTEGVFRNCASLCASLRSDDQPVKSVISQWWWGEIGISLPCKK
jgi:hypothetical protein